MLNQIINDLRPIIYIFLIYINLILFHTLFQRVFFLLKKRKSKGLERKTTVVFIESSLGKLSSFFLLNFAESIIPPIDRQ